MIPISLPSPWTRRPRPATGDSPLDLVRHHPLALSSPHIPVVIPLLSPLTSVVSRQSTSSKLQMESRSLGSRLGSLAAQSLRGRCPHSLRRKILLVGSNSMPRGGIRSRRLRQWYVSSFFFFQLEFHRMTKGDWSYHHWFKHRRLLRLPEPNPAHLVKISRRTAGAFPFRRCIKQ